MFINGALLVVNIEHTADILAIDQTILEGKSAGSRPDIGIGKNSQLHAPELGNIDHFLFRDPDIASPSAAGTAAGGAGVVIEGERKS